MSFQENSILSKQSSFEQYCSQFDWYDFKVLSSFLTKLDYPLDTTTQSLHSIHQLFKSRGIAISKMTISRKLNRVVLHGLLRKLPKTNPVFYQIARGQEELVRKLVYFKHTEETFGLMEMDGRDEMEA
jgi:hypothetical protein